MCLEKYRPNALRDFILFKHRIKAIADCTKFLFFKIQRMKRFTLFLIIIIVIFSGTRLLGQCTGALTVNVMGSSTGGSVTTTITTQPTNQTASLGGSFTLTVVATGSNLTYQWKKGGVDITINGTSATYTKTSATAADAGIYSVVVHGDCGTDVTSNDATVTLNGIKIQAKVFLEGPYKTTDGMMTDALTTRTPTFSSLIPTTEPYTSLGFTHHGGGGEMTTNSVLQATGPDAIVDWIFLELRNKANPALVLYTRSALLQRDGDIVDVDGVSPVTFTGAPNDDYYFAVKHRNHLGFRPLSTVTLNATPITLNFTNNSITLYGTRPALKEIVTGVYGMYAGDANHNGVINSVDKNSVWRPQNGSINYFGADFNLNGAVNAIDKNEFWLKNNSIIQQLD